MKIRTMLFIMLLLSCVYPVMAQTQAFTTLIGLSMAFGEDKGFAFSATYGVDFDEAVFYGLGIDGSFTKVVTATSENNLFLLPFYGLIRVRFPLILPFSIYGLFGLGYSLGFNNSVVGTDSYLKAYGSFYWKIGAGLGIMLGSKTDGLFEVHFSSYDLSGTTDYPGTPVNMKFVTMTIFFGIRFFRI